MILRDLLREKCEEVVGRWLESVLDVYPSDSRGFLRNPKNPFANPIGSTISRELRPLFEALLEERPPDELVPHLEGIVQITCIQDVSPSRAVSFVFELKEVLRSVLFDHQNDRSVVEQLRLFEKRIDQMALLAFDCYARFQRQISAMRVREAKGRVSTLLNLSQSSWEDVPPCDQAEGGCSQCES